MADRRPRAGSAAVLYFGIRVYRAFSARLEAERRHAQKMAELHMATIEALALAIDAKDQIAPNHIRRVQTYATGVARALGMSEDEIQGIRTAALLHDIGKLAVPEHILAKPGPLTPEEFQKVRIHPQVGADIIAGVPFPYPVAPLILSHHERWDGRGYPAGLKQEEIPLGARILCVADYFDALTSDRPYHKAIGSEAALAILQQESGKALDPGVVSAFARIMPQLRAEVEKEELETPRVGTHTLRRGEGLQDASARCPTRARAPCSTTSPSRTAKSTRSTRSRRRWARAWAWRTRWRSSPRS